MDLTDPASITGSSLKTRVEVIEKLVSIEMLSMDTRLAPFKLVPSFENNAILIEQLLVSIESNTSGRERPVKIATVDSIAPFFWLHVPKTGSSFATTLAYYAAPTLPPNITVKEPTEPSFRQEYGHLLQASKRMGRFDSGHVPLSSHDAKRFSGKIVVLLRPPFDRTLSGFGHAQHDCIPHGSYTFSGYAECVRGCTAKMLTGSWCAAGVHSPHSARHHAGCGRMLTVVPPLLTGVVTIGHRGGSRQRSPSRRMLSSEGP